MSSRSQQSIETKNIIARYKKILSEINDDKIALLKIKEAADLGEDSIQKNKISKSLIDYLK